MKTLLDDTPEANKELQRVFEIHEKLVKDEYKGSTLTGFIEQYYDDLSNEILEDGAPNWEESRLEISSNETISGHAEIISW